jgi:hypothetical protein
MGDIFTGQVGVKFSLDTQDDPALLAAATKKEIWVKCRTGKFKWTASLDGTIFSYTTTASSDLPCSGEYFLQTYAEGVGWKVPGRIVTVKVLSPLNNI